MIVAIIPARIGSSRFARKALAPIQGEPMICMVRRVVAETSLFDKVIVATDDQAILNAVQASGGEAVMTSTTHMSGTDRIAEAVSSLEANIIVNVQGDEPLIDKVSLAALLDVFQDESTRMASLMAPITGIDAINDHNIVKVVVDSSHNALYFSRAPIPYNRDGDLHADYYKHIGVYAFRRETLLRFVSMPPSPLEQTEKLEQLRALENGIPIRMVRTNYPGIGVDTPADLARVEELLRHRRTKA